MSSPELPEEVILHLEAVGYSFHEDVEEGGHWFCWSNGDCDVESGDTFDTLPEAHQDAMNHWFSNAKILMQDTP